MRDGSWPTQRSNKTFNRLERAKYIESTDGVVRNNKSCIRESFSYSPRTLLRNFVEAVPTELIFLLKNSFLSSAVFFTTYFFVLLPFCVCIAA